MSKPFKLSAALYGHSLDIRSVAVTSTNSIISGSRDNTAKLWIPNGFNSGFNESITYKDQKNFVASVLYLEPTQEFSTGLIVTGGNDNTILIYKPHEPFASYTLKEHSNTVCYLSNGIKPNTFLSSSWDNTAKLWLVGTLQATATFSGHTAAVWAVIQIQNGNVVTASADKTIGVFSKEGFRINTIQGHTDCVRGLTDFHELNCFISVSNDASIKVWSYSGEIVNTYYGHTNYIYSIARNTAGGNNCFVTSDEDRTVRYWKDGINTEMIVLPAQSVWTVACFANGDIVTGSSDGVLRVFTQDETRFASDETLAQYEQEVNALAQQKTQEIGGYKVSDLPGREALFEPGKRPGQMKMVREAEGVVAYTWVEEGENSHWEKVGEVLGGNDPAAANKTTYEGKAYDYVFSVDVEDGKPPLKLPYNKGDDPYVAAHNFLEKNMLPAAYLDQVVDFILKNSKDSNEGMQVNSEYVDPFTGAARYTPATSNQSSQNAAAALDPFTGASSYMSAAAKSSMQGSAASALSSQLFPQMDYRGFEAGDPKVILTKLKELNEKAANKVPESSLEDVLKLCSGIEDENSIKMLFDLLNWPDNIVFPAIDVLRLSLRHENCNKMISTHEGGIVLEKLKYYISQDCKAPNSTLVAFRALCNMFMFSWGEQLIFDHKVSLLENVTSLTPANKNIEIAMATFLLNATVLCQKIKDDFGISLLASVVPDIVLHLQDAEAQYRGLITIGTLMLFGNTEQKQIIKNKIKENENFINKVTLMSRSHTNDIELKRKNCALQVLSELIN